MKHSLSEYKKDYDLHSKKHVETVIIYGPEATFGYPLFQDTQRQRIKYILSKMHGYILDVGCDSGYILNCCSDYVFKVGIDISMDRLLASRKFYSLNLVHSAGEYLPFQDEFFDVVIMGELLEHVLNPLIVLDEVYRVLRVGGHVVITVPDELHGEDLHNPEHLRKYTVGMLKNDVMQYFGVVDQYYVDRSDVHVARFPVWCLTGVKDS